jgi:type IV pilus assembly protein PilW
MRACSTQHRQSGVGLIEVMVGLLIGMIAVVVMMQVFSVSEGYKRTTTGGVDAQNNGAIALFSVQRDLRQSGQAMNSLQLMGCSLQVATGRTVGIVAPVIINPVVGGVAALPPGDANTDTLLVMYSNTNGPPEGELVQAQPVSPARTYTVSTPTNPPSGAATFAAQDRVVAVTQPQPSPCALSLDTVTSTTAPSNVTVATGVAGMANGILFNVGAAPKITAYAVRNGNLTVCDYLVSDCGAAASANDATVWVPIASNVVSLRAQYGRDTTAPMDSVVDIYDQTMPTTACQWSRVSAVRVALVARSALLEKDVVTAAAPTWSGTTASPAGSQALAIDVSRNPDGTAFANWDRYRYKVFETLVPQRNMVWAGVQAGC